MLVLLHAECVAEAVPGFSSQVFVCSHSGYQLGRAAQTGLMEGRKRNGSLLQGYSALPQARNGPGQRQTSEPSPWC